MSARISYALLIVAALLALVCTFGVPRQGLTQEPALQMAPTRPASVGPHGPRTGFVPPPLDLPHLTGRTLREEFRIQAVPASWDWRAQGKVTSVKDQGACGACYAFASIANIESKLLIDGAGAYDFSENNAKECNWHELSGFEFPPGYPWGSCDGGNYDMMVNLFSTKGTVLDSCDPYEDRDVACKTTCAYQKTLLDWRIISGRSVADTAVLKQYIHSYGPVYTAMYASFPGFSSYNGSYTIYYPGTQEPDHAVLIVGWDDSLPHAGGTGGWIVKNSWGTGWGGSCGYGTEAGYFTIAYGSASIGQYSSFVYGWQDYDTNGSLMYYDEAGNSNAWGCTGSTTAWGLVRFVPASNTKVTRVEFWTSDATTDVDIYLYDDFDGTAPSNLLAQRLNDSFDEAGYHSVALSSPLSVNGGDDIIVLMKLTNQSFRYPVVADSYGPPETGRTYISCSGSSGSWTDLGVNYQDDVAIRLRTSAAAGTTPTPTATRTPTPTPTKTPTPTRTPTPTSTPTSTPLPAPAPNVGLHKAVIGTDFQPGDPITFTLGIANTGDRIASGAIVTDIVPGQVLTPTFDSTLVLTRAGVLTYVWDVGPLGVGEQGVITINGWVDPGLPSSFSFTNVATISDPEDTTPGNNTSSVTVVRRGDKAYLPVVMKRWPPIPDAPVLNPITNPDGDGNYTVSWNAAYLATSYTLQEDDDTAFSSPTMRYAGSGRSWSASGKATQTYYYRVRARNSWGDSGWSNVQGVSVRPPSTFYVVGDACILQGYPTTNYGSASDMWVGYDDYLKPNGKIVRSLIQFDTSAIPPGTAIDRAALQVYLVASWDYPSRTRTVTARRIASDWSESDVTWSTSPRYAEAYGSASVTHAAWGWYSFDVTDLVRGWVNGSVPNHGIMLRGPEASGEDSSWRAFSTREGSYPPTLVVTYSGFATGADSRVVGDALGRAQPSAAIIQSLGNRPSTDSSTVNLCGPHSPAGEKCLALP